MFVTFACIICLKFVYFALQIYVNLNRDIFLVSREKKMTKFAYFLETSMLGCSIF